MAAICTRIIRRKVMCHRDSNCGAQTCRRCESVLESIPATPRSTFDFLEYINSAAPTTKSYERIYLAYVESSKEGDTETTAMLRAVLRNMHYRMGGR